MKFLVVEKYGNLFEKVYLILKTIMNILLHLLNIFRKSITKEQLVEFEWLRNDIDLDDEIYAFDEESDWSIFLERPFKIDDIELVVFFNICSLRRHWFLMTNTLQILF